MISINLIIVRVSRKSGTLLMMLSPSAINAAVIIGNTAFLAPLILTEPDKGFLPLITIVSITSLEFP